MSILDIFGSPYGKKLVKKEIKALLVLSQKQPLTVDKLCREIDDKHYIIVKRLAVKGLIEFKDNALVAPLRLVYLSEKGKEVVKVLSIIGGEVLEKQ